MWLKNIFLLHRITKKELAYRKKGGKIFLDGYENLSPEKLLEESVILKDSRTVTAGIKGEFFIKRYNKKTFWKALKRTLQSPRSYRCLAGAVRCEKAKIHTPQVLYADRYFLVTRLLEENTLFLSRQPQKIFPLIPELVKLHENGLCHGDLSLRNIYCTKDDHIGFIDLDSCRNFSGRLPVKYRIQEIARVLSSYFLTVEGDFSNKIMENFLEKYENAANLPANFFSRKKTEKAILSFMNKTNRDRKKSQTLGNV